MESRSGSKRRYDEVEPRVQRRIVAEYRQGVRGYGYIATAKRLQLPVSTVRGVIARAERAGGDPVAPRGHKKRKLDSGEEVKLCRALEQNATATNRQLSAVVRGKVAARTVSDYLARADPPFTTKVIQVQELEDSSLCERSSETRASTEGNTHPSSAISLRHKVHVACIRKAEWCAALGPFGQKRRHERD